MDLYPALRRLAEAYGIAVEFWDWQGKHVDVPAETIIKVLAALEVDASSPEAAERAVIEHGNAAWRRMLPPSMVIREGWAPTVDVHVRHGEPVSVWIDLEAGGTRSNLHQQENWAPPRDLDGQADRAGHLPDPRGPAAGVSHAQSAFGRRRRVDDADRHPGLGRVSGSDGRSPGLGDRHPAVQRPVRPSPGGSATSATWRTSRCGAARNWAPGSC